MTPNWLSGNTGVRLRTAIERRLSGKQYAELWKSVEVAFAGDVHEEEAYWDYALGLADSWRAMSRAPSSVVHETVIEIADMAEKLANKIAASSPELRTVRGYLDVDKHTFMAEDLRQFSDELKSPVDPTEAMLTRPRGMSKDSAERTYFARALTWFLCAGGHKPMARVVATTVRALLDLSVDEDFDEKQVRDVTEDICRRPKTSQTSPRRRSQIL